MQEKNKNRRERAYAKGARDAADAIKAALPAEYGELIETIKAEQFPMPARLYTKANDRGWIDYNRFDSPYQMQFHLDGRRRWRRNDDEEWMDGTPPENK